MRTFRQGDLYCVFVDEDQWITALDMAKEAIIQKYTDTAKLEGANVLAIFADPDTLFPLHGNTERYRVYEKRVEPLNKAAFRVDVWYDCEISTDEFKALSEHGRAQLIKKARDHTNEKGRNTAGRYRIFTVNETGGRNILEQGRI